ncbi:MAG TPA: glycosyltransferase [Thermoanaerobaculia bacterium]|jgi:GT2 family glycosyltransferase
MSLSAVVPTLGRSPLLVPCLQALRGEGAEIVVVDQGEIRSDLPAGLADRVLRPGRNLGFAAATNSGIAAAREEWIATVNDDALVEPGWAAALLAALAADPKAAAAQGVNLLLDDPERADGCGIGWNRWWQAVQVGHGKAAPAADAGVREIFGASATAAIFRREAFQAVAAGGGIFDERLGSYYEDVDLAVRLRAAGYRALLVPAARARHAGSLTGRTLSRERWRLIYGNRWRVARRYLQGGFWPRVPLLALRDGVDLARALLRGEGELAAGIVGGWGRALRPPRGPR